MRPLALGLTGLVLFTQICAADQRQRLGRAYDRTTGDLVYVETHVERLNAGEIRTAQVVYTDSAGRPFARKSVDFSRNPQMPTFRFENTVTGHLEAMETGQAGKSVTYRESHTSEVSRTDLEIGANGIADAGFDRFIERNWEQLLAGPVVRPFLVPSRGSFIDFRVRHEKSDSAGESQFVLEVDSALLRLVADPITVVYSTSDRLLLRYSGLSNVRDEAGDNYDVSIIYDRSGATAPTATR